MKSETYQSHGAIGATVKILIPIVLVCLYAASIQVESNESLEVLKDAETRVQAKIEEFSRTDRCELLVEAQKVASSLNPREGSATFVALDAGTLRLQLKELRALADARDLQYDPSAKENRIYLNVAVPESNGLSIWPAGIDPNAINDPTTRMAYEDAIAENNRRIKKVVREAGLSAGLDYAVLDIWIFVRGFPAGSEARKSAFDIIEKTLVDEIIRNRILAERRPGVGLEVKRVLMGRNSNELKQFRPQWTRFQLRGASMKYLAIAVVAVSAFSFSLQGQRESTVQPLPSAQVQSRKNAQLIAHIEHDGLIFSIEIDATDESLLRISIPRKTQSYTSSSLPPVRIKVVMADLSVIEGPADRLVGAIGNGGWDDIRYRFALGKRAVVDEIHSVTIWIGDQSYTAFTY